MPGHRVRMKDRTLMECQAIDPEVWATMDRTGGHWREASVEDTRAFLAWTMENCYPAILVKVVPRTHD